MHPSNIYEKYYVDPSSVNYTFPETKRSLIYIFMESMESSYADKAEGGTMDVNYIPNLTKLAKENVQFSDKADKIVIMVFMHRLCLDGLRLLWLGKLVVFL